MEPHGAAAPCREQWAVLSSALCGQQQGMAQSCAGGEPGREGKALAQGVVGIEHLPRAKDTALRDTTLSQRVWVVLCGAGSWTGGSLGSLPTVIMFV